MATKITIWIVEMTNSFLQCGYVPVQGVHVGDQKLDVLKPATAKIAEMIFENDQYRFYLETTQ